MKKGLNKILTTCFILFIMASMFSNIYASDLKTSLNIIQKASETKYLDNNQGYISKTIVDSDEEAGEVTIELKISNIKKQIEEMTKYENTEIYIMVSENIVKETERLQKNINNIEKLVSSILKINSKTKIGIIGIKGTVSSGEEQEDGSMVWDDNDQGEVAGNASNAEIVVELTDNANTLINGIKSMNSSKVRYRTNLQAAIKLSNQSYSNDVNKILISLYDSVPSIAIGVKGNTNYGGWNSPYRTPEEAVKAKHEEIATRTKNEILTLKTSNVSFFMLRPDDTSYDETWYSTTTGEKLLDFDGSPYVQKLYGTIDNPTYGKMYSFNDESINSIITENIYQDVKQVIQQDIKNVKVQDYFPKDITDNFEFSYVGTPNIGKVTNSIDNETKAITWNIEELKGNEVATLRYNLKIKDMQNKTILSKTISTNEKVELTYKDTNDKEYIVILDSSPKIQLSEVKEGNNATNPPTNNDPTIAKGEIPQTGIGVSLFVTIIILFSICIIWYLKFNKLKDIK